MSDQRPDYNSTPHPVDSANICSRFFFWWLNSFFWKGFRETLSVCDLYRVPREDTAELLGGRLESEWKKQLAKRNKKPSLVRALLGAFWGIFAFAGALCFIEECIIKIAQAYLLGEVLKYFQSDSTTTVLEVYLYATGIIITTILHVVIIHPYFHAMHHIGMKIRVACISLIYKKALRLSSTAFRETTVGQMVNLLSSDVNRFDQCFVFLNYLWVAPVQFIFTMIILHFIIGPPWMVGALFLILLIPFQICMGSLFSRLRIRIAKRADERIRLTTELLTGIQIIKMYSWEVPFSQMVEHARKREINVVMQTGVARAINFSLFNIASKVILYFTFVAYALSGNSLEAVKVFITVCLYNNIRLSMTLFFPYGIAQGSEMLISVKRIQTFLLLDERESNAELSNFETRDECRIHVENMSASWYKDSSTYLLNNISFQINHNELLAVIGPIGCGKTSLLLTLLNELPNIKGRLKVKGSVAFVSYPPWIFQGTVLDNVLFGKPFNATRYAKVLNVCALDKDLVILPHHDQTIVGDRGVALSGGQKARLCLARAVYADADIYLLDDPLSAVDPSVARHLYDICINGFLRNKTRILVTHQHQLLTNCPKILVLKQGMCIGLGNYQQLKQSGIDFGTLVTESELAPPPTSRSRRSSSVMSIASVKSIVSSLEEDIPRFLLTELPPETGKEKIMAGAVKGAVYWGYLTAGGGWISVVLLTFLYILTQIFLNSSDFWLSYWTTAEMAATEAEANNQSPPEEYPDRETNIYIFTGITIILVVLNILKTIMFFVLCVRASANLHTYMLRSIVRAPMAFFETNPLGRIVKIFSKDLGFLDDSLPTAFFDLIALLEYVKAISYKLFNDSVFQSSFSRGRILNRFSGDMSIVDELLPICYFDFIEITFNLIGIVVLISIVNYWMIIPAAVLFIIFYSFRKFYLTTARDVKRIEGTVRSPVFSHLSTTMHGLTTIRAYQSEKMQIEAFHRYQNTHSSSWYTFIATTRWFGIWLDWLCICFIAIITYSLLFIAESVSAGGVGLSITSALLMVGSVQWAFRQSAEVENQMTSVERIIEYQHLDSEPPLFSDDEHKPYPSWPQHGIITYEGVYLYYNDTDPPVLKNIYCCIRASEKVGIVGRTGAGKTSFISTLFRLKEPEGMIRIDGINIQEIGLHDLRKKLSIIPQEPVLFTGTVKQNLDPFQAHTDEELWEALEYSHLRHIVEDLPLELNSFVAEGGANFSAGERQLFCLARAILRRNKILILDEATANVDQETDALIQRTVRQQFKHCTVITIAHRLGTIMDSDRVMVLDQGKIVEFDEPYTLLQDSNSQFYEMVQATGSSMAEHLMAVARHAYLIRSQPELVNRQSSTMNPGLGGTENYIPEVSGEEETGTITIV